MPLDLPKVAWGRHTRAAMLGAVVLALSGTAASQPVDLGMTDRIVEQGTRHSQVMTTAEYLADMIGPRLTNSPGMRRAETWALEQFRALGLSNVRKDGFEFGRGWWMERSSVRMVAPRPLQLTAVPISWTPSTNGPITAPIVFAPMEKVADFAAWRGKLAGRIVLISPPEKSHTPLAFSRLSVEDLAKLDQYQQPSANQISIAGWVERERFPRALEGFLKSEGAVAYVTMTKLDGKLVMGDGFRFAVGDTATLPGVEISVEDYRRLVRLAAADRAPTLSIDTLVHYDDSDTQAYNILADLPGSDAKAGYVMAGAHLDSAAAADGAADNGAGVAMVIEAARILATLPRPKRTIRFALWSGEEQGLLGSIAYVEKHLAIRGDVDPTLNQVVRAMSWSRLGPLVPRLGWRDLSAYFNLDNGSGKIRGIYAERNVAAVPIFREWLAPFATMGASTVAIQGSGGSDQESFGMAGVPGFQFIQDWADYGRMHHTSMDTYDHLNPEDMRQGAVILASFLWNAANAEKAFPRRPPPLEPQ